MVVGFNLPFDLSRLAISFGEARGFFAGGLSLVIWDYTDEHDGRHENRFRPRIVVRTIDSKRAFIQFTRPIGLDSEDQIPEGSTDGLPDSSYAFPGHFLDCRTVAFNLTNQGHSLRSACETFGVQEGKGHSDSHGAITPAYITYNRQDVEATAELSQRLVEEYWRHPIALPPTHAKSPAAIGKAYFEAMGIAPPLDRQPDFPRDVLGQSMTAYYGGRAECRIRRVVLPVMPVDFLSMYPTVNALMGLWDFVVAERIEVEDATEAIRKLVREAGVETCLQPRIWRELATLVLVEPNGEIFPTRADYAQAGSWGIGCNPLETTDPKGRWYSLADVLAAKLLTGRPPTILRAVRLRSVGQQANLTPAKLRGTVAIDPARQDFFRAVVEERQRAERTELPANERERLRASLKVIANSTSYGIFAEMNRTDLGQRRYPVSIWGLEDEPFIQQLSAVETPGAYSFPPLAACVTGAARLMLALLERLVTDAGGDFAFCDTDSMAIVATEQGAIVKCPGAPYRSDDGSEAVKALTWEEVDRIVARFEALNPYDRSLVPGSILEHEPWNFDQSEGGCRSQLYCYAISAKRYALFNLDKDGSPVFRKVSEHGLGHLLNPTDPEIDDRGWIETGWLWIVREALGLPTPEPSWFDRPAMSRLSVSSAAMLRPFVRYNDARPFTDHVKPFNFLLSTHVAPFGHPPDHPPERFHLIAPYEPDPRRWPELLFVDLYSGDRFSIATEGPPSPTHVRIKTYGDVLAHYRVHPEPKSLDPEGDPCGLASVGVLSRRPVKAASLTYIGKESNRLEEVGEGLVHGLGAVLSEYDDPSLDPWRTHVLPALRDLRARSKTIADHAGVHPRTLQRYLNETLRPRPRQQAALLRAAAAEAGAVLRVWGIQPPRQALACLAAYLDARPTRNAGHICPVCGAQPGGTRARYCSERCKKRAYRERKRTGPRP